MRWRCGLVAAALAALSAVGCRNLSGPDWWNPGTAPVQRLRAQIFDPYPEQESAPEIIGGRPREYDEGVPEIERARHFSRLPGW